MKKTQAEALLSRVAQNTELLEGAEGVRRVLFAVTQLEKCTSKELARQVSIPLPVVAAVRRELEKEGLLVREGGMSLSSDGEKLAEVLGLHVPAYQAQCVACAGTGLFLPDTWKALIENLSPAFARRPDVDVTLDQSHGTVETSLRRAAYLLSQGLLVGKRLLFLGDDDFTSLACAALLQHVAPQHTELSAIRVLEIDRRYIEVLKEEAGRRDLAIDCVQYDAREELPDELHRRHDVFLTDPPYTLEGLSLFLSRGLHGLDRKETRDVLLSYPQRAPIQNWELQYAILELGLSILRVFPAFNQYHGAAMHANVSALYHLQVTPAASPLHQGKWEHPIYTGENRPATVYRCKSCRREISVGPGGDFPTMRELKSAGCPGCGARVFLRVGR